MRISWIQKLSLIDYPGKVACVVFTPGCNLRCSFCHNPEFVLPERLKTLRDTFRAEGEFFDFLDTRRGLLDGISICGGEPTLQRWLLDFCRKVKERGFLIKLDTNGGFPDMLQILFEENLIDYMAMDIKHTWQKYPMLVGREEDMTPYKRSVEMIMKYSPDYEFRTTVIEGYHDEEDIEHIAHMIAGAKKYVLQSFREWVLLDEKFLGRSPSQKFLEHARGMSLKYVQYSEIRT
jgi:pyruvate formate lyase activating enzyme